MANDIETMRDRLRDKLRDADDSVWSAGEKDEILQWAVRRLAQRVMRPLDPETYTVTLVSETYYYTLSADVINLSRVDLVDSNGDDFGPVEGWELVSDFHSGLGKLHVSPNVVEQGGTLHLHGYGRYVLVAEESDQTAAIRDDHVPLVLDIAAAEAYARIVADRVRFKQWQNVNQVQNVSVTELLQMVDQAERSRDDEWLTFRTWQKPVPGRI